MKSPKAAPSRGLGTGDGPVYTQGLKATAMKEFEVGMRVVRNLVAR